MPDLYLSLYLYIGYGNNIIGIKFQWNEGNQSLTWGYIAQPRSRNAYWYPLVNANFVISGT